MKIVDYVQFNSELELLEFHLDTLYEVIDHFIIVESDFTFTGKPKNLFLQENWNRFNRFQDKIVHVINGHMPFTGTLQEDQCWANEIAQRNRGLLDGVGELSRRGVLLKSQDSVIISDCDEIADPQTIQMIKDTQDYQGKIIALEMDFYYYDFRRRISQKWYLTKVVPFGMFTDGLTPHTIRNLNAQAVQRGGWHLSYFGGIARIQKKLGEFSHQEFNTDFFRSEAHIASVIDSGSDLFGRENVLFEPNDFTYMPPDWRKLHFC